MREIGAQQRMVGKEWNANIYEGGHKFDIKICEGYKICWNQQKKCWVAPGKKYIHEERDARRIGAKLKEMVGG